MSACRRLAAATLVLLVLASGCGSTPSREDVRAYLDATFQSDPQREDTWLSDQPVEPTADALAGEIEPQDLFTEQQATFMRNDDYVVAVFPEAAGSRIEFDDYDRMRTRYLPFIAPFWGPSPGTYGPRGDRGGGFRGGGSGFGK